MLTMLPRCAAVAASLPSPKTQAAAMPVLAPPLLLLGGTEASCAPSSRLHSCRPPCASPDSARVPQGLAAMLVMGAAAEHPRATLEHTFDMLSARQQPVQRHRTHKPASVRLRRTWMAAKEEDLSRLAQLQLCRVLAVQQLAAARLRKQQAAAATQQAQGGPGARHLLRWLPLLEQHDCKAVAVLAVDAGAAAGSGGQEVEQAVSSACSRRDARLVVPAACPTWVR